MTIILEDVVLVSLEEVEQNIVYLRRVSLQLPTFRLNILEIGIS